MAQNRAAFAAELGVEVSEQAEPNDLLPQGPQSSASLHPSSLSPGPRWLLKAPALLGGTVQIPVFVNGRSHSWNTVKGASKGDEEQQPQVACRRRWHLYR